MNIPRSSFYRKPSAKSSDRMKLEADLVDCIEGICLEFPRYGYRRVTHQLKREGWRANHKKVLRLMRESDLLCQVKRKWVRTTNSNHHFPKYPNLIKGMVINRLNQVWISDITYIRIKTGFVYLAAILDACSRRVIGYALSTKIDSSLTIEAFKIIFDNIDWSFAHSLLGKDTSFRPRKQMVMILPPFWLQFPQTRLSWHLYQLLRPPRGRAFL